MIGYLDSKLPRCVDTKIHVWLLYHYFSWRGNFLEECEAVCHYWIHFELVSWFKATIHWFCLSNSIQGLGIADSIGRSLENCDNSAPVFSSKNNKYSKGPKHIEIKSLPSKEVHKRRVSMKHISNNLIISDLLSRGLRPKHWTCWRMRIIERHYWYYIMIY